MASKQVWLQWADDTIEFYKEKLAAAKENKKKIKALPNGENVDEDPTGGGVSTQDEGGIRPPTPPHIP